VQWNRIQLEAHDYEHGSSAIAFSNTNFFSNNGNKVLTNSPSTTTTTTTTTTTNSQNTPPTHNVAAAPMMIVLGSGGHTGEMLCLLSSLDFKRYVPRYYVIANTDRSSEIRAIELEHSKNPFSEVNEKQKNNNDKNSSDSIVCRIPRSREVKQSYITSIYTTIRAYISAVYLIHKIQPSLLLCNGPGTCLPVVLAIWTWRLFFRSYCRIIFIESFCRVRSLSLCGRLLYFLVDRFIVQWPQLCKQYTLTEYIGRLC
jgi:beta-1,4-N-acetylglucosaminyltransferase